LRGSWPTVGRRTRLPRVTLLLLIGIAAGPSGFGLIPDGAEDWFDTPRRPRWRWWPSSWATRSPMVEKLARHGREILIVTCALLAATMAVMGSA
jgi:NhaP-type Na+/H+ or K+/H+ antiporter